jgi:hypothetical protein
MAVLTAVWMVEQLAVMMAASMVEWKVDTSDLS